MVNMDADLKNSDWIKQAWDFPGVNTEKQLEALLKRLDIPLEVFKQLPVYQSAPWLKHITEKGIKIVKARGQTPNKFKRVKVTGSRKPGYIRGTAKQQTAMLRFMRRLHLQGMTGLSQALAVAGVGASLETVLAVMNRQMSAWGEVVVEQGMPIVTQLYQTGLAAGAAEVGFSFDSTAADVNAVRYLATKPNGLVPALQNFVEEERTAAEKIIRESFAGGEEGIFDLPVMTKKIQARVGKERFRIERLVRTETSKIVGQGRLQVWAEDPDRDMYLYHWIPTLDGRHKDISKLFGEGSPYTFDRIKELWENPIATVRNRVTGVTEVQNDVYNQRCTIARTLKSKAQLMDEGMSQEDVDKLFTG